MNEIAAIAMNATSIHFVSCRSFNKSFKMSHKTWSIANLPVEMRCELPSVGPGAMRAHFEKPWDD